MVDARRGVECDVGWGKDDGWDDPGDAPGPAYFAEMFRGAFRPLAFFLKVGIRPGRVPRSGLGSLASFRLAVRRCWMLLVLLLLVVVVAVSINRAPLACLVSERTAAAPGVFTLLTRSFLSYRIVSYRMYDFLAAGACFKYVHTAYLVSMWSSR